MAMTRHQLLDHYKPKSAVVGGGGGNFTGTGALFNQDANLKATQLGVTNSKKLTLFFSIKACPIVHYVNPGTIAFQVLMQSDPASAIEVTAGTAKGIGLALEDTGIAQFNFNNSVGVTPGTDDVKLVIGTVGQPYSLWMTADAWNSYLITFDTATGDFGVCWGDGSQTDMVDLNLAGLVGTSISANCIPDLNNTNGLMLGGSTWATSGGGIAQIANVYLAAGECLSNGSHVIPLATRQKFYKNGKVQDLTSFPTGRQPEVLLAGGATGMQTNLGSATNKTFSVAPSPWENTLASAAGFTGHEVARLADAPFGPGVTAPTAPTFKWTQPGNQIGSNTVTWSMAIQAPGGHKVAVGDALLLAVDLRDRLGNYNHLIATPQALKTAAGANQANAWSSLTSGSVQPGTADSSYNVFTKIADAADVRMADSYAGRDATLVATSATSITVPGGPPTLPNSGAAFNVTTQSGKGFVAGDVVELYRTADATCQIFATVNSYSTTTLNITPLATTGSCAASTDWNIRLAGYRFTWTMSGSGAGSLMDAGCSFLAAWSGVSAIGAVASAQAGWAGPGSVTTGGITTTAANSLVVSGFMTSDPQATTTPHAGSTYTERYRTPKSGAPSGLLILAEEVKATAGAYASQQVDLKAADGSSTFNGGVLGFNIELKA